MEDGSIRRLKQHFGAQLDEESAAAILAVCDGDVAKAIAFLEGGDGGGGGGGGQAYDLNSLAAQQDGVPPDYPGARERHRYGGHYYPEEREEEHAQPEDGPDGLVENARLMFTTQAVTLRQHYDFQREHYAEYVSVLLLLLHEGVEIQRSSRSRIIAAAWARHDFQLVEILTDKYSELFQLPQVLGALNLLDARRQCQAIQKKLDKYAAEGCKKASKLGPLRARLAELSREDHIGSLTNSIVKHAKKWVRKISADHLIFYALALPKEPWRDLANLLHLAPSDFADISGAEGAAAAPDAAAAPAAAAPAPGEKRKKSTVSLHNTFLGYVFDERTVGPESLLYQCQHVNEANIVGLVSRYNVPYSFLRTRVKPIPTAAKPIIASKMSLDQLIWYHEELACDDVNRVLRERLEEGEKPTLGYGKLMERLMYFESLDLPFVKLLLPSAEESLRSIQLSLEPPVYCFGDASYSMDVAIRCSTIIGSVLASLTNAELRFFSDRVIKPEKTPRTTREVMDAVKKIRADGLTAPACSLWELYRERAKAKFIIMVTDEVENVKSEDFYWPTLYKRYVDEVAPECTAVFVSFLGGGSEKGRMVRALESLGIKHIIQFRLEANRPDLTKLDTILGLLAAECKQFPDQIKVLVDAYGAGGLSGILERLKQPLLGPAREPEPGAAAAAAAAVAAEPVKQLAGQHAVREDSTNVKPPVPEAKIARRTDSSEMKDEEPPKASDGDLCVVCMESKACVAMVPCGHLCCCVGCAEGMQSCPLCRAPVTKTQVIYRAGV